MNLELFLSRFIAGLAYEIPKILLYQNIILILIISSMHDNFKISQSAYQFIMCDDFI